MFAESLKEILEKLSTKNALLRKGSVMSRLELCWPEIIGTELAKQCSPEKLQFGTLWVSAVHPGWAQQIHFYQKQLIDKINNYFHQNIVKAIRCGGVGVEGAGGRKEVVDVAATSPAVLDIPGEELLQAMDEDVSPELRQTFASAWKKARGFMRVSQARERVCKVCGKRYRGTHDAICQFCEEKERNVKRGQVERLLQEAPWANFSMAGEEVKHIGEEFFHEVKSLLLRNTTDVLRRESFRYLDAPTKKGADELKKLIVKYVSLRSGLTPDKIHAKIIEQTIGQRRFRLLRMKGVGF